MIAIEAGSTIGDLLRESRLPRHEADFLLGSALGCERIYLIAHAEDAVDSSNARTAQAWFARRRSGEPVAYITGWREFYGLKLRVTPDVLIPRAETEQLVELALERLPAGSPARVLELGTGSGAISVALASLRSELRITATDVSKKALDVARGNAREHAVEVAFVCSDWFEAIGAIPFDLIVSNPPYVAAGDPHLQRGDLRCEPRLALVGGDDGLACISRIAAEARRHLRPGGSLLLEHGYDQAESCVALLHGLGYARVADFRDIAGLPRVSAAVWSG
ncbi:MAG TPA: peptide chain release factor N(5)-glutamine methyltransferase [Burkholderiales bacterium]|nr:peptide chain release factor N(5)-glutamine methyltransferase [Burkholderiales bacterium]